jgi:amidophosphoribosyltransferase
MCGVFGILNSPTNSTHASYDVYRALLTLQHRGQDAAGILSYCTESNRFNSHKDLGLVNEVFSETSLDPLVGNMAIGHTRYATTGSDSSNDVQPLVTGFPIGIGLAHNGNIVNYHKMAKLVNSEHRRQLLTNNDLEIFLSFWCRTLMEEQNQEKGFEFSQAVKAAEKIFESTVGAYSIVGLLAGEGMFGMRDPNGIRPLILGKRVHDGKTSWALSSETLPLEFLDFEVVRNIEPGELVFITSDGDLKSHKFLGENPKKNPCMFEWVYFSAVESTIENRPVYGARRALGERLGLKVRNKIGAGEISPDIVCPVPDTSRSSAIALAESLNLTYREGLIKNRYVQRSFILKTQEHREKAVELKLNPVRSEIQDKNILLVDDSVVRGTTSKRIIQLLRRYGAKEITLAITCPPIRSGCFYGVDFPKNEELIAFERSIEEIEREIGVDKIVYLDSDDLVKALKLPQMCQACVTGKYPTNIEDAEEFSRRRDELK